MQEKSALLVMDMQMGILANYQNADEIAGNVSKAIETARSKNIPVMYARLGFRPGFPEINQNNKIFSGIKEHIGNSSLEEFMKFHPSIAPKDGDVVVEKRRVSAFSGNDLDIILRAQGINHLILCGVSTSGVVLSTLREAADKDYKITVLADCYTDADAEIHKVLTEKVFVRQAEVVNLGEWK